MKIIDHFNVNIEFKNDNGPRKGVLVIRAKSKPAIEGGFILLEFLDDDGVWCQKGYSLDQIKEYSVSVVEKK